MLVGITTGGKVGLGLVALAFIGFALVASFVFPRRNPDFPGERLRGFIWLTVLLFVALMAAVVFFAKESEEGQAGEAGATHATTETGETDEAPPEPAPEGEGDPAAGKEVYAANGCGSCHTLEDAGSSGAVGPNLDDSQPDFDLVVDRVTNGMGAMPPFGDSLSDQQINDVAAYVVDSTK